MIIITSADTLRPYYSINRESLLAVFALKMDGRLINSATNVFVGMFLSLPVYLSSTKLS